MRSLIKALVLVATLSLSCASVLGAAEIGGILEETYNKPGVAESFRTGAGWWPYPAYSEREEWEKMLTRKDRENIVKRAEKLLDYRWEPVPASAFFALRKTGDKQAVRSIDKRNRCALIDLMLGELFEGKGRFLSQIADGIWFYATSWHWALSSQTVNDLPLFENERIALGSARISATVPVVYHIFKDELDKMNPMIGKVFKSTVKRIILDPYLDDKMDKTNWWLGFTGKRSNNWNPWCNHGVLVSFFLCEDDQERLSRAVEKSVKSVDLYLACYSPDGACNEGSTYWGQSVARLCEYLQLLRDASGGKFEVLPNDFIHDMGAYISRATIGYNPVDGNLQFINYGDASPNGSLNSMLIWKTGVMYGSEELMDLAVYACADMEKRRFSNPKVYGSDEGYRQLEFIRSYMPLRTRVSKLNKGAKDGKETFEDQLKGLRQSVPPFTWYPVVQQAFIQTGDGWFVGAKGGNNGEGHGHNDVGSCIVYCDNVPIMVDPGVGKYTEKTFGKYRYTIWTMVSDWHNCPKPNGVSQKNGENYTEGEMYAAGDVTMRNDDGLYEIGMDLSKAYGSDSGCNRWFRTISVRDASSSVITITDSYSHSGRIAADEETFIIPGKITVKGNGAVIEHQGTTVCMEWSDNLTPSVEINEIEDSKLKKCWDGRLYRLSLKSSAKAPKKGEYKIRIYRK